MGVADVYDAGTWRKNERGRMPLIAMMRKLGSNLSTETLKLVTGSGTVVVVVVVVVVTGVCTAARIHTFRPDFFRQTNTVFFFLMVTVTRAPSLAFAHD